MDFLYFLNFWNHQKESREFIKAIYVYFAKEGQIDDKERDRIIEILESEDRETEFDEELMKYAS